MSDKAESQQKRKPPPHAWKPGQSGNPAGCKTGSRHKATIAAQALLDGEGEALTRKCIELALAGDMTALRLCLERIVPVRRERALPTMVLPELRSARDAIDAVAGIVREAAAGNVTAQEAAAVVGLIEAWRKSFEVEDLEKRIQALEFPELFS